MTKEKGGGRVRQVTGDGGNTGVTAGQVGVAGELVPGKEIEQTWDSG